MKTWDCETCIYYPPSSCDGKPCSVCDASDPVLNCYSKKEKEKEEEEEEENEE